jgi:uncharacterized protein involved in response to NO
MTPAKDMHGSLQDRPRVRGAFLATGLRPFFLLAALDSIFVMTQWLVAYFHPGLWPANALLAMFWHAHEMLFGFVAAAISGFLLTAVPGWTGRKSYAGRPLLVLVAIWLAGRVAMLPYFGISPMAAAAIDLAFFPALVLTISPSLIQTRKLRNFPFIALLLLLFAANCVFHLGVLGVVNNGEMIGIDLAMDIALILIVIIGGRIIPAFTKSGLARRGISVEVVSGRWIDAAAIASVVAVIAGDVLAPLSRWNGAVALVAALVQGVRLSQWQGHRTLRDPLIWVLHAGYAWLVVGLALKGLWLTGHVPFAEKWLHAITVGAFATMIMAVMTRASLGHTGRTLIAPAPVAAAYLLISLAAVIRVFAPAIATFDYDIVIWAAGLCWIGAFSIFLLIYTPILMRPRADGKPG